MTESQAWTATIRIAASVNRANSDPVQFAGYIIPLRLRSYSADADHRIELPLADRSQTIMIAEYARFSLRIADVCPFVNQCSHLSPYC